MKSIQLTKLGLGGLAWALAVTASAENWPTWRGPAANGVAPGGNPPTEFSENKNIQWKIKVPGSGSSTPVIWGDQVFVITAEKTGKKVAAAAGGESRERGQGAERRQRPDSERPEGRGRGEQGSRDGDRPRPDGDQGSRGGERPRPDGDRGSRGGAQRGERGGRPGFGGGSFNREEFIKRFDKDGDGELNDAERDAMRDELRQQFSRGRGGERSSRSGRSSRGRGGFGGGGKPTDGGPEKAVAGHDEDSVTMAVAAAIDCLRGVEREDIDALFFASTTNPYREKQAAALVCKALALPRDALTAALWR